jgi:hypothetical protein
MRAGRRPARTLNSTRGWWTLPKWIEADGARRAPRGGRRGRRPHDVVRGRELPATRARSRPIARGARRGRSPAGWRQAQGHAAAASCRRDLGAMGGRGPGASGWPAERRPPGHHATARSPASSVVGDRVSPGRHRHRHGVPGAGAGSFRDWEIFNRPAKGPPVACMPATFVAALGEAARSNPPASCDARGRRRLLPYAGGFASSATPARACPTCARRGLSAPYPIAEITFNRSPLPECASSQEAFNPFIPQQSRTTPRCPSHPALKRHREPARRRRWTSPSSFAPTSTRSGTTARGRWAADRFPRRGPELRAACASRRRSAGLELLSTKYGPQEHPRGFDGPSRPAPRASTNARRSLEGRAPSTRPTAAARRELKANRRAVADPQEPSPTPDGLTHVSSLAPRLLLGPGSARTVEFVLAWYIPLRE